LADAPGYVDPNILCIWIRRKIAADILVDDPEVSASHARIVYQQGGFRLQDLDSTNAHSSMGSPSNTTLCGMTRHDDVLRIGHTFLRFEL
jgi:pSer/pThr/pTyr-binding forkhead associated (FHA) protein